MDQDSNTIIQDAFANLNPVVQKVLTSAELAVKLQRLSKKHALHLDKWTLLENEITMTLLGITDPDSLISNIESHVGVERDEAQAIANDAAVEIFNPIRDELEVSLATKRSSAANIPVEQRMIMDETEQYIPASVAQEAPPL